MILAGLALNDERMTKHEGFFAICAFERPSSFVIRISSF